MSDIWKDAPEGATHIGSSGNFFKEIDGKFAFFTCGVQHGGWLIDNQSQPNRLNLTPRPEDKPVYTQADCDAGVLPSVGVECLVIGNDDDDYYNCEILMHRNIGETLVVAVFVIKNFDGLPYYYSHCTRGHFKPLDNRDDEEKAFDKFLSDEYNSNIAEFQGSESDVDFIVGLQSAWKAAINFKTKGE